MRGMDFPLTVITASLPCSILSGSGGLFFIGSGLLLAPVSVEGCAGVGAFSVSAGAGVSGIFSSFSSVHGAAGRRASTRLRCSLPASVNLLST